MRPALTTAAVLALWALGVAAPLRAGDDEAAAPPLFAQTLLSVDVTAGSRIALTDADGDGRTDLLQVGPTGLHLRLLDADGTYPAEPDWTLLWPAEKVGWDLADIDGDGATDVIMLLDGSTVRVWHPGRDAPGPVLLTDLTGFLPRGIRRMRFVRDVDGDGRQDAVIPGAGRFLIHRGTPEGLSSEPLVIAYQAEISLRMGDPTSLDGKFEQDVTIPLFGLRDIDGDGRTDLISETEDELAVHLGTPELSPQPSWRLDLAALREEVQRPESLDLEDLFANIPPQVRWQVADIDGVAPLDLVLQRGGRFTLHLGGSRGPDLAAPDQVLKASGNVMLFRLRDVDGDGRPDLQILRAETISLGTVLRWLMISGSLDFDVFTYPNEGRSFARTPAHRKSISLRVPAILGLIDNLENMEDELTSLVTWPARPLCLDGDGQADDIVDVGDRELLLVRDRVPADWKPGLDEQLRSGGVDALVESAAFGSLDTLDDGDALVVDLGKLDELVPTPGWDLHLAVADHEPAARLPYPEGLSSVDKVRVLDLDGDGLSDLLIVGDRTDGKRHLWVLVRRAPGEPGDG